MTVKMEDEVSAQNINTDKIKVLVKFRRRKLRNLTRESGIIISNPKELELNQLIKKRNIL